MDDRRWPAWARALAGASRGLAGAFRDRHGRRARVLAGRLDAWLDDDEAAGAEITLRPWELRLPRLVVLAVAESRGFEPVGGWQALVERGPWLEPMRFRRPDVDGRHREDAS